MNSAVVLQTPRLVLRELEMDDWQAVLAYAGDAEVMKYMEPPNDEARVRAYLDRAAATRTAVPRTEFHLAITLKASRELIGGGTLFLEGDAPATPWFGIMLNRHHWRQGFAVEACGALFRFGFDTLGAPRVCGACNAANKPSEQLMRKLGMSATERVPGPWFEIARFAIDREAWHKRTD